jgi:D-tyrosyl-tRNA(Tyr) deacylase
VLAVVQRVSSASVHVGESYAERIGPGLLILLGVARGDEDGDARWLAEKCASLRIFNDADGKMNLGLDAVGGEALVVSQFTLLGDCERGRRPSFTRAAEPAEADRLYMKFVEELRGRGVPVKTGVFAAMMRVALVNEGPVTILVDSAVRKIRRAAGEGAAG